MRLTVVKAIIQHTDGMILALQKDSNHDSFMAGKWELPGGKMKQDESYTDTLHREIKTETGITVKDDEKIVTMSVDTPKALTCILTYHSIEDKDITCSSEHQDYRWVEPESFRTLDLHRDAKYAIPVVEHLDIYR